MNPILILLLLCLIASIYIFYKFFKSPFFHNIVLTYIAILFTLHCFTPNGFDWFYLFQMDSLFESLKLSVFQKAKVEAPITQDVIEQLILISKNQNLCFETLIKKVDLMNNQLTSIIQQNKALMQQGQVIANANTVNLEVVSNQMVGIKDGLKSLQVSFEATSKDNLAALKDTQNSLNYLSDISIKSLENLQSLNSQFLVSSSELNKINSVLNAQTEISSNGFTALHKAMETSVTAQADLQNQIDLVRQRQTDLNYKQYTETQKILKSNEAYQAKTDAEIEALKPKKSVTETKVNSSWFNSFFSNKPKA